MLYQEFKRGDKDIGIIVGPKYYQYNQFIGNNYGVPLKRIVEDVVSRMVTISTFEPISGKKINKKELKEQCDDILEACATMGIDKLLVSSSEYFKHLTGSKGFEDAIGLVFNCVIEGYEYITVCPTINPAVLNAQPAKAVLLTKALNTFGAMIMGNYRPPEDFKFESYKLITDISTAKRALELLRTKDTLAIDIETTGLRVGEAEVLTIAFAWDNYNAITFICHDHWGFNNTEDMVNLLKDFFKSYQGVTIYHNCLFDLKILAYSWWMKDFSNYEGLYEAVECLGVANVQDTMLLAYAELNSTDRPQLGLKVLSKDFLGDYAEDVKDCKAVPLDRLAEYNAKDVCGTFYVYNKFKHQKDARAYSEILQPSIKPILHMMLHGLPIDLDKVDEADIAISEELMKARAIVSSSAYVKEAEENLNYLASEKYNSTHKSNKTPDQFDSEFNPNSAVQLRVLLFDVMEFEAVEFTEAGSPSTARASIKEFITQCPENDSRTELLKALVSISETAIIQNTFISAFKELSLADWADRYSLHGNLRLGGTQSGRLSSSEPNLQNLPSGSTYGKAIKNCFKAPDGWLFAYADFASLEDKIGAILSKDENKTLEFTKGVDGHSMRAAAFFKEELEERDIFIDMQDAYSINRVKDEAPDIRGLSKGPSFAMQYGCAAPKLQKMLKCSKQKSESIFHAFHDLYSGLDDFAKKNEQFAKKNGYIELAFGLQLKTPRINSNDGAIQSSEARSASNAATQSYGMLMNRAFIELLERLEHSEYKYDVKIINTIHDAVYLLVKEDINVINWVNHNLVECMEWQDDPKLLSDVKIGAELDIGKDWGHCVTLANNCSLLDIEQALSGL